MQWTGWCWAASRLIVSSLLTEELPTQDPEARRGLDVRLRRPAALHASCGGEHLGAGRRSAYGVPCHLGPSSRGWRL